MEAANVSTMVNSDSNGGNGRSNHAEAVLALIANAEELGKPLVLEKDEAEDPLSELDVLMALKNQLEVIIQQVEGTAASEAQRVQQIKQNYEAEKFELQDKLRQKEELLFTKDSALRELEEKLTSTIHSLENQLRGKEELLQSRDTELNALKSETDDLMNRIAQSEALIQQLEAAPSETERAQQLTQTHEAENSELQARLREKEEMSLTKDPALRELEEKLTSTIHSLENQLRGKEELLQSRDTELKERDLLLKAKAEEILKLQEGTSTQIERLASSLKEKQMTLAALEKTEWQSIRRKQLWNRVLGRLETK